jgi:hypothetical protein
LVPAALLAGAAAIAVRYARSSGEERLQLKWIVAVGLLVVVAAIPFAFVPQLAFSPAAESAAVSTVKVVFSLALVSSGSARNTSSGTGLPAGSSRATSKQNDLRRMSNDCAVNLVLVCE